MMGDYSISPTAEFEHFPPQDERARSTRGMSRSGRASPTHSAHAVLFRPSLVKIQTDKKAKKVRFYRNGDLFFKGMIYAVSPERFRTFESLIADLTNSPLGDKNVLPNGVRTIFSIDGSRKITNLDQLEEGESYVCASTNLFKKCDYPRSKDPSWNHRNLKSAESRETSGSPTPKWDLIDGDSREFIHPKLITVIRNGARPRRAVRVLLNRKTAHSFDQVLTDITNAIKLETGAVRKIFTLDGQQVTNLHDFFRDESVFLAYGLEKYAMDDFDLDDNECKFVSAYRSGKSRERVTLKSPKVQRKRSGSAGSCINGGELQLSRPPSSGRRTPTNSPRVTRKSRAKSPVSSRPNLLNGIETAHQNGNGHAKINGHSQSHAPTSLISKYNIGKVIGAGNFATVKECSSKETNKQFALKIIDKSRCKGKEQMIENEVSILRRVKHENIIQLIEEFDTVSELYLVMELVNGGDFFDAISSSTKYTERDASGMLYNLMSAVKYLHDLHIVHRDIKPENILMCEHFDGSKSLKLGDFGLATEVDGPLYTVCGTPTYVAPEIIAENGYGFKVDIWSSGVITYILLCGFPPFVSTTHNQEELFDKILAGTFEYTAPFWDDISDSAKELISNMLQVDPDERFSATEVIDHPWVADDVAKDEDFHDKIADKLTESFEIKPTTKERNAGVAVIAATALDKESRFFQGRKNAPLHGYMSQDSQHGEDEVF